MTDKREIKAGDVYLLDLDPVRGSEQAGVRPVIVISSDLMHQKSKRMIICPITGNPADWTTKLALPGDAKTKGMVLTDQVRAVDKQDRALRFVESLPAEFVTLVRSYVGRLLDLEVTQP